MVCLCTVCVVLSPKRDAADRERAIARIFQLYGLWAAGCAHALIAKREAGRIQSRHRPDTGARKAYMLWARSEERRVGKECRARSTRCGCKEDTKMAGSAGVLV